MTDSQRVEEPRQCRPLARGDRLQDAVGRCVTHPVQGGQLLQRKPVHVGGISDEFPLQQLLEQFWTDPVDIHRVTRAEMNQPAQHLRWTGQIRAARHRLAFRTVRGRSARRAGCGHGERPLLPRAPVRQHPHDLGNHLAGPLHDHPVADADVFAADLILIVQRRAGHGDA